MIRKGISFTSVVPKIVIELLGYSLLTSMLTCGSHLWSLQSSLLGGIAHAQAGEGAQVLKTSGIVTPKGHEEIG